MKRTIHYTDTRGNSSGRATFTDVVVTGIAPGGGLFVPEELPQLTLDEVLAFSELPYWRRAASIFSRFGVDVSDDRIDALMQRAYGAQWDDERIAPLHQVTAGLSVLELWHGPTSAFKDMALQCMPLFFSESVAMKQERGQLEDDFLVL
ncbi:MAG: threonine synthase, partial [Actinobacteria bacterium]